MESGMGRVFVVGVFSLLCSLSGVAAAEPTTGGADAPPPLTAPVEARRKYYEEHVVRIWRADIGGYTVGGLGGGYVLPTEVWEGRRGRPLEVKLGPFEFYDAVGRPDLRSKAVTHTVVRVSLVAAGLGLLIGGGVYQYSHWDDPEGPPTAGWIVMGAGGVCFIVAYALGSAVIDSGEAEKLAKAHNKKLRLKLGLPAPTVPSVERTSLRLRAPASSPWSVAGLTLAREF
jgi:hypothetical protein